MHPTQFKNDGRPDSTAFSPSPRDQLRLSTRRSHVGAAPAHAQWEALGRESAGTWSIRPEDFPEGLVAYDDSALPDTPPGHASVDFSDFPTRGRQQKIGRQLRDASWKRGNLFARPPFALVPPTP